MLYIRAYNVSKTFNNKICLALDCHPILNYLVTDSLMHSPSLKNIDFRKTIYRYI